jgi:RimJ/RimL family protein N-acetyltransferase
MASDCVLENVVSLHAHLALGYTETNRLICFRKPLSTASPAGLGPLTSGARSANRSQVSRPTPAIIVRQIEERDAERFLELAKALDAETVYRPYDSGERRTTVEEQHEIIRRIRAADNHTILLAEFEGQLVGCLEASGGSYQKTYHTVHVIVAILLRFTGQGIGTRLFEELERWASERGLHRLQLSVMLDNPRALRLYQRLGFQIEGVKRHSMRIKGLYVDEYSMSKLLD